MIRRLSVVFPVLLTLGLALSLNSLVFAASDKTVDVPEGLGPEAMNSLVSKLDAEQTDALVELVSLLDSAAAESLSAAAEDKTPLLDAMQGWISNFGDVVLSYIRSLPHLLKDLVASIGSVFNGLDFGQSMMFVGLLAVTIGAGFAAEYLAARLFSKSADAIRHEATDTLLATLKMLTRRFALQTFGIVVFGVVAFTVAKLLLTNPDQRWIANILIFKVIIFVRFSAAVLRFVLAPERADLRLVSTDGVTAKFLYSNLVYVTILLALGIFVANLMRRGQFETLDTWLFWLGLAAVGWIMTLTWRAREGLTSIIIGEDEDLTEGLKTMAAWWPRVSIAILGLLWLLIEFIHSTGSDAMQPGSGILMIALIVVLPFLDTMVRGIASHLVPPMEGEGPVAEKAHHETKGSYVRIGRVILFTMLIFIIARLLGLDLRNLAEAGLGAEFAANVVGFLVILAAGYIAMEVTSLWINRQLAREMPDEDGDAEEGGAGLSRTATILPILRMSLQATIVVLTVLLALSQLGVNITPLLAGAGVLGLAIGFGAQTLVKDVVSGVFFLLDDAFRMGEYIDVGGMPGTVQKISIRSMHLRDAKGPIHIVPYGSISKLTNMSRDWVIMKLKFIVPFDTDIEKVRKLFKKIGQQILAESEYKDDILAPFKSQGPADVTDVGIVIRGKFTTKPGGQWMIRREIYTAVQKAFKENGIEFARKEVRVQMPEGEGTEHLSDEQKKTIAGAVSEAAEPAPKT